MQQHNEATRSETTRNETIRSNTTRTETTGSEAIGRWWFAALGGGAFAGLLAMEFATTAEPLTVAKVILEVLELALTVAAAVGTTLVVLRLHQQHEERLALIKDLEAARLDGQDWRRQAQSYLDGLGAAIEKQLQQWRLTDAEAEVAFLLLKGFSHKEIGALRGTSEATVRQQARVAYEKSGLKGRAAFCAFFLEDLLPTGTGEAVGANPSPPTPSRTYIDRVLTER